MAASGALITLPAWANGWSTVDLIGIQSSFSASEEVTLSSVVDTIIPAGDSVGALTVGVDKFLQKLFADCYEEDVRRNISEQLAALESVTQERHAKSFSDCDQIQREELLSGLVVSETKEAKDFFELIKGETIRGFRTSREVMLDFLDYKIVPGHYFGCVDINV